MKFATFSGVRPPRLSARTVARYATAKSLRSAGTSYPRARALSLFAIPWRRKR